MSVGSAAGFTSTGEAYWDEIFAKIAENDMIAAVSAGNSTSAALMNGYGTNTNLTSDPDNGIVSSPATWEGATMIASIENASTMSLYFVVGEKQIAYNNIAATPLYALAGSELEYVMVPGLGTAADFAEVPDCVGFDVDFDDNGVVDTADAQLLYELITSGMTESDMVVEPGETVSVNVELQLTEWDMAYMETFYENGIYVDGFVRLSSLNENGVDLSLPFVGFYGDWSAARVYDGGWYYQTEEEREVNRYVNVLWTDYGTDSSYYLGVNPYIEEAYDPAHNDGILYSINYNNGDLYTIDPATCEATFVGATGCDPSGMQSMTVDHDSNKLYWAAYQGYTGTITANAVGETVITVTCGNVYAELTVIVNAYAGELTYFDMGMNYLWMKSNVANPAGAEIYENGQTSDYGFTAAAYANGYVYAADYDNLFYRLNPETMAGEKLGSTDGLTLASGAIYGMASLQRAS